MNKSAKKNEKHLRKEGIKGGWQEKSEEREALKIVILLSTYYVPSTGLSVFIHLLFSSQR